MSYFKKKIFKAKSTLRRLLNTNRFSRSLASSVSRNNRYHTIRKQGSVKGASFKDYQSFEMNIPWKKCGVYATGIAALGALYMYPPVSGTEMKSWIEPYYSRDYTTRNDNRVKESAAEKLKNHVQKYDMHTTPLNTHYFKDEMNYFPGELARYKNIQPDLYAHRFRVVEQKKKTPSNGKRPYEINVALYTNGPYKLGRSVQINRLNYSRKRMLYIDEGADGSLDYVKVRRGRTYKVTELKPEKATELQARYEKIMNYAYKQKRKDILAQKAEEKRVQEYRERESLRRKQQEVENLESELAYYSRR